MRIIKNTPDFDVELTFEFTKGEKVTPKDVAMIADELCEKCDDSTTVLGRFCIDDIRNVQSEIGVRQSDDGFSPRENCNVGKFVVQNGGWWSEEYIHPDGKNGDTMSSNPDVDVIEQLLNDYDALYPVSVYSHSGTSVSLINKNIIPIMRQEYNDYLKSMPEDGQDDGSYDYYELKMIQAFKRTLELLDDEDLWYGINNKDWKAVIDDTDIREEEPETVYEAARSEIKEFDKYLNEPQYATTMDNDLNDWCYGYYNDEYGVVDQIISQCIRPMHDAGLIEYVGDGNG